MPAVNMKYQEYDVRIDRKTHLGNPFVMRKEADRGKVIAQYREWLWKEIKSGRISLQELAALKDKRLGCHCAPRACHGDVLSAAADWAHKKLNTAA